MAEEAKKEEVPQASQAEAEETDVQSQASQTEGGAEETGAKPEASKTDENPATEKQGEASVAAPAPEPNWKDQYARLLADFDNFKKRTARDREESYRFAEASILKDVLPTVDNLSLALANAKDKDDEFVKGVRLVYETLLKALKDHAAEPFDSVGQALDTEKMEAIATLPSTEVEEGKVSIESKKGWTLKGKVLRAAQVVVSSGKPEEK